MKDVSAKAILAKKFVRSGIRTHAQKTGLRPERSALDRSAILTWLPFEAHCIRRSVSSNCISSDNKTTVSCESFALCTEKLRPFCWQNPNPKPLCDKIAPFRGQIAPSMRTITPFWTKLRTFGNKLRPLVWNLIPKIGHEFTSFLVLNWALDEAILKGVIRPLLFIYLIIYLFWGTNCKGSIGWKPWRCGFTDECRPSNLWRNLCVWNGGAEGEGLNPSRKEGGVGEICLILDMPRCNMVLSVVNNTTKMYECPIACISSC